MSYGFTTEPMSNEDALRWVKSHFGSSFIKTISRTKYTARILAKCEDGDREVLVSLPRSIALVEKAEELSEH